MNKLSISFVVALSLLFVSASASAQLSEEVRPFDFNNDYYKTKGIYAETLINRRNGADGLSVVDTATDPRFTDVRITATYSGYAEDGSPIYWNHYATATKDSFTSDEAGAFAVQTAKNYPVYVFPSAFVRGTDRQSALIPVDALYFEKNAIGVAETVIVEFSSKITRSGRQTLDMLLERNGASVDGTPIIRTAAELKGLITDGLVTIRKSEEAPYAIAKVIQFPDRGAIAPDAFLLYISQADGKPLAAEQHFVTQFECLKNGTRTCLSNSTR